MSASQPDPSFHRRPEVFGGGPTLVSPRGEPLPPMDVVMRLRELDERLSVEWVEGAWGTSYFGLFQRWEKGDKRWERVQNGEIPEKSARDLIQMFPRHCPAPEMAAYVEQRWGGRAIGNPVEEAERAVEAAKARLERAKEAAVDKAVDSSMDRFNTETAHDRRVRGGTEKAHPMVSGADFTEPKRLIEVK